jgi:hypothetical protein
MKTGHTSSIISRSVLLGMKNISDKIRTGNQNNMFNNFFFENRAVYEITWKHFAERGRPQMIIWRIYIKVTNTHTEYVILIAFSLQQWFARTRLIVALYYAYPKISGLFPLSILWRRSVILWTDVCTCSACLVFHSKAS